MFLPGIPNNRHVHQYFLSQKCFLLFTSAAYIQVHFRLDIIMEANTMNPGQTAPPWEQSDLDPYCFQNRLPKNMTKVKTGGERFM